MSCVERLYTKKTFTRADLHMISRYRTHGKGRRLRSLCDRRRRLRSYREECFESTSVRSDCGTCSRTTVQTQLAACGDWKNAGQKERETLSGWLADQAASPYPACHRTSYTTSRQRSFNLETIVRRRCRRRCRRDSRDPGAVPAGECKEKRRWEQEKLIRINNECDHTDTMHLISNRRSMWKFLLSREYTFSPGTTGFSHFPRYPAPRLPVSVAK